MLFSISILSLLSYQSVNCSLAVDYYDALFNQRNIEIENYTVPVNNGEFQFGIESTEINNYGEYDFIIVGAGTAGSVVATRLSEIDNFNILLLEAGGEENDFSVIPNTYFYNQASNLNWNYFTIPQNNSCLGMPNRRCSYTRGKVLGGSSSINEAVYSRGSAKDYERFAQMGNPSWSYKNVLPYFIKSENSQIDGDVGYHGKGGLWNVEYALPFNNYLSNFLNASAEINAPFSDYNGRDIVSSSPIQFNHLRGKHQSTNNAFLIMARQRRNLKVVTNAFAAKLIMNPETKTAEGVQFVTHDKKYEARARKEVIVSGGSINSPQILLLSGIGPRQHLDNVGIQVVADLPVGENVWDHVVYPLIFETNVTIENITIGEQIEQYLNGVGPLTRPFGGEGISFVKTNKNSKLPSMEYIYIPPNQSYRFPNANAGAIHNDKANNLSSIVIFAVLLHPKSRGQITLNSSNPTDYPLINSNVMSDQEDVDTMKQGITTALKMMESEAFQKIDAQFAPPNVCTDLEISSHEYWECTIRQICTPFLHISGSNAMGPNPKTSVVNQRLMVHGVKGLRVVDSSVFPTTISAHTAAPTVMVAEKISDEIKMSYGHPITISKVKS